MKVVSLCLLGVSCPWDGKKSACNPEVVSLLEQGQALPLCPEQLGGLPTPREPSEQQLNGRVVTKYGIDVTENFNRGAREATKLAVYAKCDGAILRHNSPSCGCGKVYDGTFTKKLVDGDGVFAQYLKAVGITNIKAV